ncbi:hypothetical protein Misp01_49080 [Microtetraspora sp. NBRC 13810]|uniref:hypothetical protein n=1 Tax=Microtetraspora sp. NBRC 13810 TaxID=3030990 RepID=UPI0024A5339F|nr:hypothetical protein [Microtetraspora sp. NBRC 13810]GLW09779.1 hypothetical protein Misp01_49080 [Microtetraspora sp. NBRC 13810]
MTHHEDAELKRLDRLTGTWKVAGGAAGQVTYRWLEGGFFLVQDIDLEQDGRSIKGIEVIGGERVFGAAEPSADLTSRFYGSEGSTFGYVYEIEGDTLTVWGGEKGSPACYRGVFDADGTTVTGAWVHPGGGGPPSTMTRIG